MPMGVLSVLKFIDNYVGKGMCYLLPRPRSGIPDDFLRILVIRPGGIGDAVLQAQVINSVKKFSSKIHISILAECRNEDVFSLVPGVDEVFCYNRLGEFFQVLRSHYDVVIDTEQWYRLSAVAARLVRSPVKIGFASNERRRMFTHGVQYDQEAYEPDNFASLLKPLGIDCRRDVGAVTLELPFQAVAKASQLLQPLGSDSFVVVFPGASIPEKRWGAERFSEVARKLIKDGYRIVVVGGKEDRADGDVIVEVGGLNIAGTTTLAETAAVIARSSLVLCGDSGVLHIAAALDIPTVSLFGPSNALKWAPRGDIHIVVSHPLPCSPCSMFGTILQCPIDARCIKDITPEEVIEAIGRLSLQPPVTLQ